MTILQINEVCGRGSTGTTTLSIGQALEEQGHESYVAYGHGTCSHPNTFKIGYNWEDKLHALLFTRILGLHGFGSYFGTKRLLRKMEEIRPDIIHLRNLHCNYQRSAEQLSEPGPRRNLLRGRSSQSPVHG